MSHPHSTATESAGSQVSALYHHKRLEFDVRAHLRPISYTPDRISSDHTASIRDNVSEKPHHADEAVEIAQNRLWLPHRQLAPLIMNLLLDLVVASSLQTFASSHGAASPSEAGDFFAYFAIFEWIWLSQTLYDVRYQADDWAHRLWRLLQFICIAYFSAFSAGWAPTTIEMTDDVFDPDNVSAYLANQSWTAVCAAYAASRALLALQHIYVLALAMRARRPHKALYWPLAGLLFSGVTATLASALSNLSEGAVTTKLVLLYLGIVVEIGTQIASMFCISYLVPSYEHLSERLATFTLIVLGEGVNSVLGNFSKALGQISNNDSLTYFRVFLIITATYLLFLIQFTGFAFDQPMNPRRTFWWTALHAPMHFILILFLFGLSNDVLLGAYLRGVGTSIDQLFSAFQYIGTNSSLPYSLLKYSYEVDRLSLTPSWIDEITLLNQTALDNNSNQDGLIVGYQYLAQILYNAASGYSLNVGDDVDDIYTAISNASTIYGDTQNQTDAAELEIASQVAALYAAIENDNDQGGLWLLPCAGGSLVLASLLNIVRYRHTGFWLRLAQSVPFFFGTILVLLSLLNIGGYAVTFFTNADSFVVDSTKVAPIISLTKSCWAIGIVTLVYFITEICLLAFLAVSASKQRKATIDEVPTLKTSNHS